MSKGVEKMELLKTRKPGSPEHAKLYMDILNVGEYAIEHEKL